MCGFVGFVDRALPGPRRSDRVVREMAASIEHRGPDDEGFWHDDGAGVHLGFRRLSILDLSEAGHQPMVSASGRWVILFNGEVYNHEQLKKELGRDASAWRGDSDTEVLLAAIEAWGPQSAIRRFQGMFALAIYDRQERDLWLARDRMGIKPLYLAAGSDWIAFGSEIRTLSRHPRVSGRGSRAGAWHYLRTLYVPAPLSIMDGVEKVRPGALIRFRVREGGEVERHDGAFWDLEEVARNGIADPLPDDPEVILGECHRLLEDSVRLRLVADVPVGALLSGGVDSSLVVALMAAQSEGTVQTFTIRFDDPRFDEGPVAKAVAEELGTSHTAVALPTSAVRELVPQLGEYSDEPMANPSLLPTLLVSRVARESVVVALSGDGGDELFAGYNRYAGFPKAWSAASRIPGPARVALGRLMRGAAALPGFEAIGSRLQRGRFGEQHSFAARVRRVASIVGARSAREAYLNAMSVGHARPPLDRPGNPGGVDRAAFDRHPGSLLGRMLLQDQLEYLPDDLLAKVDRASMWTSLEARVPILDHRVVELSWRIPDRFRIRDGEAKWPLRALARRYLPAEILERPKMGFTVPIDEWLRSDLSEWVGDLLAPERLARRELWDVREVTRLRDRFFRGEPGLGMAVWTAVVLEDWSERRGVTFGGD